MLLQKKIEPSKIYFSITEQHRQPVKEIITNRLPKEIKVMASIDQLDKIEYFPESLAS